MSLRVWLPLNGTLENKGISDLVFSNTNTTNITIDDNGKTGKCYSRETKGNDGRIISDKNINLNNDISMCCWAYVSNCVGDTANGLVSAHSHVDNTGIGITVKQVSMSDYRMSCNTGYGSGRTYNTYYGTTNIKNAWHHLSLTYSKSKAQLLLYVDGNLEYTLNNYNNSSKDDKIVILDWSTTYDNPNYRPASKLNDVRIYDHCLSPKEVKEISQGLVLHYKLDGLSGGSGENLAYGTNTADISTNIWRLSNQTGGTTNSIEYDGNTPVAVITRDNVAQSGWTFLHYDNIHPADIKPSTTYTISFDVMTSVDGAIGISALMQGNATNSKSKSVTNIQNTCTANTWSHIVLQTVTKDDFTDINNSQVIYLNTSASLRAVNVTIKMKNMKMEIGSKDTPWSPALTEIGIDTTKIIDSSGYGNDGIITGTLSTESDSDRYEISTKSLNGTDCIKSPLSLVDVQSFTCSFWVKPSSSNGGYSILASNYNNPSSGFWISTNCESHALWFYNSAYADTSATSMSNNDWHHCVIVCNNKTFSMYIDGIQQTLNRTTSSSKTITVNNLSVFNSYTGTSWNTKRYGNISDFRFYISALSAEDILDLYHTSANIDNEKRLHSFEFVEDDGNRVDEQGLVHSGLLSSDSDLIKLLYDKKLHIEPDGSVWAHIYHHNRPDLGSFSSTDNFANSVKIDDNRWFNATEIVNSFSSEWEFLIIYNFTQGGTVYKERWIQTKNPETAVFGDVDAADITRVTGGEYKTGTWGGLYKKNGSAYWVMNNGTNGHWWGATGSFSIYQGGIPGYGGTVTTTGCNDLYIRIDRFSSTPTQASIGRGSVYIFNDFIEK